MEFAICGALLLTLILGVVEFGRILFTLQVLDEGARRAARVAAVCAVGDAAIADAARFVGLPGASPVVTVQYLNPTGGVIGNAVTGFAQIRFVRVIVSGYSMPLAIPFLDLSFDAPPFTSTLPRESLGIPSFGAAPTC